MILQEIFETYENDIQQKMIELYNQFDNTNKIEANEAKSIYLLITYKLSNIMDCQTIYTSLEQGYNCLVKYLKQLILPLTTELRNTIKSLSKEMGKEYTTTTLGNIVDNNKTNLEENNPMTAINSSYNYTQAYLANSSFLLQNTKTLDRLLLTIVKDCVIIG